MAENRFHLQKNKSGSKINCPGCGKKQCFVRYIDEEGAIRFPETVGKCDHEGSCGYHYSPREYVRDNPNVLAKDNFISDRLSLKRPIVHKPVQLPSFIDGHILKRSLSHYEINPLYHYFTKTFGEEETNRLFRLYHIGTSAKWGGATIYWQVDVSGRVRTGKIMLYDPQTGKRVKEPRSYVSWAHSELHLSDFNLRQCLFGEHLLPAFPSAPVMIVEGEKTALIMSHFIPDYIWLATGGKNGCFNSDALSALQNREVTLIPDLGATEQWWEKSSLLFGICKRVIVSDVLERIATVEQRNLGLDVADFFLNVPSKRQILQQMIERNPALQLLIDEFGLALVE